MKKIVIDTNVLVSAIMTQTSHSRIILRLSIEGKLQPLIGDALFNEYEDVLARDELFERCPISKKEREKLLNAFLMSCEWIKIFYKWRPNLRDEADNHLVELAIAGGAECIVTKNVKDLQSGELVFDNLSILSPTDILKDYDGNHNSTTSR